MFEQNSVESNRRNLVPCWCTFRSGSSELRLEEPESSSASILITYAEFESAFEISLWHFCLLDTLEHDAFHYC